MRVDRGSRYIKEAERKEREASADTEITVKNKAKGGNSSSRRVRRKQILQELAARDTLRASLSKKRDQAKRRKIGASIRQHEPDSVMIVTIILHRARGSTPACTGPLQVRGVVAIFVCSLSAIKVPKSFSRRFLYMAAPIENVVVRAVDDGKYMSSTHVSLSSTSAAPWRAQAPSPGLSSDQKKSMNFN